MRGPPDGAPRSRSGGPWTPHDSISAQLGVETVIMVLAAAEGQLDTSVFHFSTRVCVERPIKGRKLQVCKHSAAAERMMLLEITPYLIVQDLVS